MSFNKTNADEVVSIGDETLTALCCLDSASLYKINTGSTFKTEKCGSKSSRTSQNRKLKTEEKSNISVEVTNNRNECHSSFFKLNHVSEAISTTNKLENSIPAFNSSVYELSSMSKNESVGNVMNNCIASENSSIDNNASLLCTQEKVNLSVWGLPTQVLKQYESFGVVKMFPWQVQCLCNANVLDGGNLVYSAPTSAGKTLVAEILAIKTVLERKKKVVIILPFVSVVREKMFYFQDLLSGVGVRVAGLMGNHKIHGGFKNLNIAICTIEKANSLINRLMEEDLIKELGTIVVDELHLLGDPHRGYLLELLLTKILYMCKIGKNVCIQIIGMSATLPNLDLLAKWLNATLYKTDFRPIPLQEQLKIDAVIYDKNLKPLRTVQPEITIQDDTDQIVYLCLETVLEGHSTLIFCPTKNWCETLSQHIAKEFHRIGISGHPTGLKLREQLNTSAIVEALEQFKQCPVGLDSILKRTVSFGVAFHHAGLTIDERDIIEGLFRGGVLRVLVATSTLSSGVNLPARRVIIRSPMFHGRTIETQTYRQMIGRAGRMGRDSAGESLLICNKGERRIGEELIQADLKPIESCLGYGELSVSLKRAVLEVIASGVAHTPSQLECYINCTLLAASESELENPIKACVDFLHNNELIRLQNTEDNLIQYFPTPLGTACLAASISPDDGLHLFKELQKARQCFVLETDLHLVYQVTPLNIAAQWGNLDWFEVLSLWEQLPQNMRRVGELVGVEETFMVRALRGTVNMHGNKQVARINRQKMAAHKRFYTALALQDLINEVPLTEVATKFKCSRGMLQSLQQTASTFAGMVTAFCKRLGWDNMELLFSQFQERLQFGIHRELCDLMKLDFLNGIRARALFNAGICTLSSLASANVCEVENALHKATPFQSSKEIDGETHFDTTKRNEMKTVWVTGKHGLTERDAATFLIKEAREYLQTELGLADAKWDSITASDSEIQKNSLGGLKTETKDVTLENQGQQESDMNFSNQVLKIDQNILKMNEDTNAHKISPKEDQEPSRNSESFTIVSSLNFTANEEGIKDKAENVCIPNKNEFELVSISDDDSLEHNLAINLSSLNISLKDRSILNQISEKSVDPQVEDAIKIPEKKRDENPEECFVKLKNDHELSVEIVCNSTKCRKNSEILSPPAENEAMYRSPSLFGDSLVMDSQLCDALDCKNSPDKNCPVLPEIKMSQEVVSKLTPQSLVQVMPSDNFVINTQLCQILDRSSTPICRRSKNEFKVQLSASSKQKVNSYSKPQYSSDIDSITNSVLDKAFETYYDFHDENNKLEKTLSKAHYHEYNNAKEDTKSQIVGRKKKSVNNIKETEIKKLRLCEDDVKEISTTPILKSQNSKKAIQENSHTRNKERSRLKFNKMVQFSSSSEGDDSDDKSSIVQSSQNSVCSTNVKASCRKLRISKLQSPSDKSTPLKKFGDQKRCKKKLVNINGTNKESKKVLTSEYHSMDIITVSGHKKLFKAFQTEVSVTQHISLAIACEPYKPPATLKKLIGLRVLGRKRNSCCRSTTDNLCAYANHMVTGCAVYCGGKDVYFIQFPHQDIEDNSPIPLHERLNLLNSILTSGSQRSISMFDLKEHYKVLHQCCNITLDGNACDPKVADWLLNPEGREKTLQAMTLAYSPNLVEVADMAGKIQGVGSPSLCIENLVSPLARTCSEALVVWHIVESQKKELAQNNLYRLYEEVEMPVLLCLAKMEITGIGFSLAEAEHLKDILTKEMSSFEKRAYKLANHSFSLTSANDIAKVLYSELRLNPGKLSCGQKPGTGKEALVHLRHQHPLPNIILQWRKLNVVLTKTVYPLLNAGSSERLYSRCVTHTATGRISMHEPNLQNIARDFDIFTEDNSSLLVSMRLAFVPKSGMVLVSADYSQLELRLLAHLSQDSTLCCILRSGRDVFRGIASNWNKIPESQVSDELRQRSKQVCYGMIYGIGVKALADQLEVDENEAAVFMETFKTSYPGVRKYIEETIQLCRFQGYIETLHKRKRFLPGINNTNSAIRAQAERQAVNSTIQGSAADIAKKAMVLVDASLIATFSSNGSVSMGTRKRDMKTSQRKNILSVASLVLHIHDEMIYEVSRDHLHLVASIIKSGMESAAALSVPLPVKVKSGDSWGSLLDLDI